MLKNSLFQPSLSFSFSVAPFFVSASFFLFASVPHLSSFFYFCFSATFFVSFQLLSFLFSSRVPFFSAPKHFFSAQKVFASAQDTFLVQPRKILFSAQNVFASAQDTFSVQPKSLSLFVVQCLLFFSFLPTFLFCL